MPGPTIQDVLDRIDVLEAHLTAFFDLDGHLMTKLDDIEGIIEEINLKLPEAKTG